MVCAHMCLYVGAIRTCYLACQCNLRTYEKAFVHYNEAGEEA